MKQARKIIQIYAPVIAKDADEALDALDAAIEAAERKCLRLEIVPRYPGEQFETPNARVEGRDAASSRRVPSHDGLAGNVTTKKGL